MKYFLSLTLFVLGFLPHVASATVGGSIVVSNFHFEKETNTIFYQINNNGGKGCAPMLETLTLDGYRGVLLGCDDVLNTYGYEGAPDAANAQIQTILEGLDKLFRINLRDEGFSVTTKTTGTPKYIEDWLIKTNFIATVYQNGVKKIDIEYGSCEANDPLLIEGYTVPNANWVVLMLSHIGDCFEGGYTNQSVHVISNVHLKSDPGYTFRYPGMATTPDSENIVVYPGQDMSGGIKENVVIDDVLKDIDDDHMMDSDDMMHTESMPLIPGVSNGATIIIVILIAALIGVVVVKRG